MGTDKEYFLSRAQEEDTRAAEAVDELAKDAHSRLAEIYRQTAANPEPRPLHEYQIRDTELHIL